MERTPEKLVFLTPGFPKDEQDLNCLPYIQDFLLNLKDVSAIREITVIAFQVPVQTKTFHWHGILVHSAQGGNRKGWQRFMTWWRVWRLLQKMHQQKKIDVIHSFWLTECALIGNFFSRRYGTQHVTTIMGQDALAKNRYLKLLRYSKMKVVGVSSFVSDIYSKRTERKIAGTIPFALHRPIPVSEKLNLEHYDILGVGNLHLIKNYILFLEVVSRVKETIPSIRAAIIGGGETLDALQKAIQEKGLNNHVDLLGEKPRNEVFQFMNQSKVFLHTSVYESQGFVLDEALYCGMQVVSTPIGDAEKNKDIVVAKTANALFHAVLDALGRDREIPRFRKEAGEAVADYLQIYSLKP